MKNKKFLIVLLFVIILPGIIFSWGEKGHELIAVKAFDLLPEEMSAFVEWKTYVSEHASDADKRKDVDSTEGPKHYIDIDYYKEFNNDEMLIIQSELAAIYSDSIVTAMGILPWATLETLNNLTNAFKEKNRDKALILISDLAHYVADGHQPMHTVLNYNGQLTDQTGIHSRYEIVMFDRHLGDIEKMFEASKIKYVAEPLPYIFDYITQSNSLSQLLFAADKYAFEKAGSRESDEYYKLLWFKTKYVTAEQVSDASRVLASLIYTSWTDAGKPDFETME